MIMTQFFTMEKKYDFSLGGSEPKSSVRPRSIVILMY